MRLTLFALLFCLQAAAQNHTTNSTLLDIQILEQNYRTNNKTVTDEMRNLFPVNLINGKEYVSFIAKVSPNFSETDLENEDAFVGSNHQGIASIHFPLNDISSVLAIQNIETLKLAGKIKPLLDKVIIGTRVDSVWAGYGLPQGYSGKDILIGITDWGFDYSSPMFFDTLLSDTRILSAWDQFKTSGPSPTNFNYGAEYNTSNDLINAGSDTANFYSYATHGSHVAGITGGSGAGLDYRGMAYESNFLFTTFLFNEAAVLDAWSWMKDKAEQEGKRLVVNMSWGIYHMGALDGTSLFSQALDNYSNDGIVFVSSAGNNGNVNFHMDKAFNNDTLKSRVLFYENAGLASLWGQSIHMWGETGKSFESQLIIGSGNTTIIAESPWYGTVNDVAVDSFIVAQGTDTIFFNVATENAYPTNNLPNTRLRVKSPPAGYTIGIRTRAVDGTVHFWNLTELTNDAGNWGMAFSSFGANSSFGDKNYGIGVPACSNEAITVGAYSSEYFSPSGNIIGGSVATFSSIGPLINGNLKPDISAPGVAVASSISSYTDASYTPVDNVSFNGRDYPFARMSGTSMSGPAVAGIVALILDANPTLSSTQVKSIIISTARTDSKTGPIPPHHTQWGWGKINALAAVQLALVTVGIETIETKASWNVFPNPTQDFISIQGLNSELTEVKVIDQKGSTVIVSKTAEQINVQNLNKGVYFIRIVMNGKVEQLKFVKM